MCIRGYCMCLTSSEWRERNSADLNPAGDPLQIRLSGTVPFYAAGHGLPTHTGSCPRMLARSVTILFSIPALRGTFDANSSSDSRP